MGRAVYAPPQACEPGCAALAHPWGLVSDCSRRGSQLRKSSWIGGKQQQKAEGPLGRAGRPLHRGLHKPASFGDSLTQTSPSPPIRFPTCLFHPQHRPRMLSQERLRCCSASRRRDSSSSGASGGMARIASWASSIPYPNPDRASRIS